MRALIVLATVFSVAWYNIDMKNFLVAYYGIFHLSLVPLGMQNRRKPCSYTVKFPLVGLFHGTPLETVTQPLHAGLTQCHGSQQELWHWQK